MKTTWNEVTISDYIELCNIDEETEIGKSVQIISILTDTDTEEIRKLPIGEFRSMLEQSKFILTTPDANTNKTFILDGKEYGLIPDLNFISTGEWLDVEAWKEDSLNNMHNYAALLCRPVVSKNGNEYTIEEHKTEGFTRRAELFREKLPITHIFFFTLMYSLFAINCFEIMQDSSAETSNKKKKRMKTTTSKKKQTQPASKKSNSKTSTRRGAGTV